MKPYLIAFIIVLIITCWQIGPGGGPYPYPVNFSGIKESGLSVKREAGMLPELSFVDKPRQAGIIINIDEHSEDEIVDFPLDARN